MDLHAVKVHNPQQLNTVIGISHFIMTCEDIAEVLLKTVPGINFGLAFCEASQQRLIRTEGNQPELIEQAVINAKNIGAGHCFVLMVDNSYPINFLTALKNLPEIACILCASANPLEVIIAETEQGRGIMGIIDGQTPLGVETEQDRKQRFKLLRDIGYKLS
ncbi:MAG: adenosine-specific kinase [bacterium]